MDNTGMHPYERYCVVRRGASRFAVASLAVREVVPPDCFVSLPGSPTTVAGLCHQRNEFLVVLNLESLAGDVPSSADRSQVLVLSGPHGPWGVLIDAVEALVTLDVSVDSEPKPMASWDGSVLGCATHNDHVVRVLDVNSLYRFAEQTLGGSWQSGGSSVWTGGSASPDAMDYGVVS
jgi:purine-binding chemotaxis protein CheW